MIGTFIQDIVTMSS